MEVLDRLTPITFAAHKPKTHNFYGSHGYRLLADTVGTDYYHSIITVQYYRQYRLYIEECFPINVVAV